MKKFLLIAVIFLTLPSFAIRAVTKEEHEGFLKSIGLNQMQILKLEEVDMWKSAKTQEALTKSRQYRKEHPGFDRKTYNAYTTNLLNEVQNDYRKKLSSFLTPKQVKIYIERQSIVY